MLIILWASWLVSYVVARLLAAGLLMVLIIITARIPGDQEKRFLKLMQHHGRGLFLLFGLAAIVTLLIIGVLAYWWFGWLHFSPRWVAVFGSIGVAAVAWIVNYIKHRGQFNVIVVKQSSHHSDDDGANNGDGK